MIVITLEENKKVGKYWVEKVTGFKGGTIFESKVGASSKVSEQLFRSYESDTIADHPSSASSLSGNVVFDRPFSMDKVGLGNLPILSFHPPQSPSTIGSFGTVVKDFKYKSMNAELVWMIRNSCLLRSNKCLHKPWTEKVTGFKGGTMDIFFNLVLCHSWNYKEWWLQSMDMVIIFLILVQKSIWLRMRMVAMNYNIDIQIVRILMQFIHKQRAAPYWKIETSV